MERVLHLYSLPYDSDYPVVCMDDVALQLVRDVRERLDTAPEYSEKLDYEYERMGTKMSLSSSSRRRGDIISERQTVVLLSTGHMKSEPLFFTCIQKQKKSF